MNIITYYDNGLTILSYLPSISAWTHAGHQLSSWKRWCTSLCCYVWATCLVILVTNHTKAFVVRIEIGDITYCDKIMNMYCRATNHPRAGSYSGCIHVNDYVVGVAWYGPLIFFMQSYSFCLNHCCQDCSIVVLWTNNSTECSYHISVMTDDWNGHHDVINSTRPVAKQKRYT